MRYVSPTNNQNLLFKRQNGPMKTVSPIFVNVTHHPQSDTTYHDTIFSPLLSPPPKILKSMSSNNYGMVVKKPMSSG